MGSVHGVRDRSDHLTIGRSITDARLRLGVARRELYTVLEVARAKLQLEAAMGHVPIGAVAPTAGATPLPAAADAPPNPIDRALDRDVRRALLEYVRAEQATTNQERKRRRLDREAREDAAAHIGTGR